jgi:hypothetical protein
LFCFSHILPEGASSQQCRLGLACSGRIGNGERYLHSEGRDFCCVMEEFRYSELAYVFLLQLVA